MGLLQKIILLALLFLSSCVFAFEFKAFGATENQAKENALSELANFLSVKVESQFNSYADSSGAKNASQQLHLSSNLPIGGARVNIVKLGDDYEATATLNPTFSIKYYESTLDSLSTQINRLASQLITQKGQIKEQTLELLSPLVIDYDKYHAVYKLLGGQNRQKPNITSAEISYELLSLNDEVDSIDMAIKRLTKNLKTSNVYVAPITPDSSHIPTPFSSVFQDKTISLIHGVLNQHEAKELLTGRYHVDQNGMQITLFLNDAKTGKTLDTRSVRLLAQAYKNYNYKSIDSDFDQAMASGVAVDSNFRASLTTNKGNSNLLFKSGDEIKIAAKLSMPGYFYIVAHVKNNKESMSYLLPIYNNVNGNDRFIRYVPANEVNREISLGEFTVESPFGLESLQLIASTQRITRLPETTFKNDYALLNEKTIASAFTHTRALKPKSTTEVQTAEATIGYLTTAIGQSAHS